MRVSAAPAAEHGGRSLPAGALKRASAWIGRLIDRHPDATAYVAILLLVVIWHRGLIFDSGYLGLRDDWTTPPAAWQNTDFALDRLSAWQTNYFGQSEEERAMTQYLQLTLGALVLLPGVDGWLTSRVSIVFLALAGVFMYQAAKRLGMGRPGSFVAAVVYMTTPFFLDAFISGYAAMLIGVALLPKAVQVAHETFDRAPGVRGFVRGSLWIGLAASSIHLTFITTAMVGAYALFRTFTASGSREQRLRRLGLVAAMGLSVVLLHPAIAFIVWQLLVVPSANEVMSAWSIEAAAQWIKGTAPTLAEALTLTGSPYNYSQSPEGPLAHVSGVGLVARGMLAGLALAAPVLLRGPARRQAVMALLGFIVLVLIGKGFNEPLPVIQDVLDSTLIGAIFRNVRYLTVGAGLLLALLVGQTVAHLAARPLELPRAAAGVLIGVLAALSTLPFWSGDLGGHLRPYRIDPDTVAVLDSLRALPHEDRMLHVPMFWPSSYESRTGHSSGRGNPPPVVQPPKRSISGSASSTLNGPYFATLNQGLYGPSRYPIDRLLAFGRIRNVLLDPHWVSAPAGLILATGEPWLASQEQRPRPRLALVQQPGLRHLDNLSAGEVELYDVVTPPAQRLGIPERILVGSPSLRPLVTAWHMFSDARSVTLTGGEVGVRGITGAAGGAVRAASEIWLGADPLDLTVNYLPERALVSPADQVWPEVPDATREWVAPYKNAWWYADPEIADMTRGLLTRADGAAFTVAVDSPGATSELWVRHFVSPEGGALEIMLDGQPVARVVTREAADYGYRWTRVEAPTSGPGERVVEVRSDGPGLNAVSQLGLLTTAEIAAAEREATQALSRLPVFTVLPDLRTTDGERTFRLARAGAYTVRLAAPPHVHPTLAINGAEVPLERVRTEAGYDILEGVADLAPGAHRLTLRAPPPPAPVVSVTHHTLEAEGFQPCETDVCGGPVRVEANVPSDGRTVSFLGRVTAGADDAYASGVQVYPEITRERHRVEAGQHNRLVRVEVPLDPGSGTATLDVAHLYEQLPGLEFELLEVAISPLPHGLTVVLADERRRAAPGRGDLVLTGDERGWAAATYTGEANERLVRLDERFDPRWVLHVNGDQVSAARHVVLDGHFNGWFVDLAAGDEVTVTFTPNIGYFWILVANLGFLVAMIVVAWAPAPRRWWRR
ncbi:MAG: hypothetical protein OXG43_09355 [Chloroflexi bacterium]|nr:hypothetical protein [Chloroflexota bacterium]